jgi:hypothetical protein
MTNCTLPVRTPHALLSVHSDFGFRQGTPRLPQPVAVQERWHAERHQGR